MLEINKEDLIESLQNSKLANSFEDEIAIPKQYLVTQQELNNLTTNDFNLNEWSKTLNKLRYWMIDELPSEILQFVQDNHEQISEEHVDKLLSEFNDFTLVKDIETIHRFAKYNTTKHHYENRINVFNSAIKNDSIGLIRFMGKIPNNSTLMTLAAMRGRLKILKYLHNNGCQFSKYSVILALNNDNVECVIYMLENSDFIKNKQIRHYILNHKNKTILNYGKNKLKI